MADSSNTTTMPEILTSRVSACAFRIVIVVRDRFEFEDAIEALIAKLDEIDPDPDLEPSLGGGPSFYHRPENIDLEGDFSDDEEECEDEGAQCDDEGALDDLPADDGFPGPIFGEGVVIDNVTLKRNYSQVPVRQLEEA